MLSRVKTEHELSLLTVARTLKLYLTRPKVAIGIERRELGKFRAGKKLEKMGYAGYYERKKLPTGALAPDFADLLNIYDLTRRKKPKAILEIGSGCSSSMFAQALYDNAKEDPNQEPGKLYSLDGSEYWMAATSNYMPDHLSALVEFSLCRFRPHELNGEEVAVVEPIPNHAYDLVYVDGGLPNDEQLAATNAKGADAVMLESTAAPGWSILVDGRRATVEYLRRNLKRKYKVTENRTHFWTLFEDVSS